MPVSPPVWTTQGCSLDLHDSHVPCPTCNRAARARASFLLKEAAFGGVHSYGQVIARGKGPCVAGLKGPPTLPGPSG